MPPRAGRLHLEKQYRYGTVVVSRYRAADENSEETPACE